MSKIILAPCRYIQGKIEVTNIPERVKEMGSSFAILIDKFINDNFGKQIKESFAQKNISYKMIVFNGECSKKEINRLVDESQGYDVIIGIGGGKALDTAKAAAYFKKLPVVIVPTAASTDAPCSALSVVYTEEGVFEEYLFLPKNPDCVIVDTLLIAQSPARLLVAGMGDALATLFEARATSRSNSSAMAGGLPTLAALELAKLCYRTLLADGLKAKLAVENKVLTQSVENIIEANTYLSGIGFESGGLAGAHAIHNGLTALSQTHHLYHGEKVAFGTIVQLVLENAPLEEIKELIQFCKTIGLPTTFESLGIQNVSKNQLYEVAKIACGENDTMSNMPFVVTEDDVVAALITTNSIANNLSIH